MTDDGPAWDVIVVGGGSAGCVLAGRLSEDPSRRVLLIEAGRDVKPGQEGAAILDMYPGRAAFDPANHWPGLRAAFQPVSHNDPARPRSLRPYEQARLMGGGSSINGQVANRGTPDDYDEWEAAGAAGWGWQDVLPHFVRLENDLDHGGALHGKAGPIPIHRIPKGKWPGFSHAVERALAEAGFSDIGDQNARFGDGYFPMTLSNDGTSRVSTAMAYLGTAVRARGNLRIMADRQVRGIVLDGHEVRGVELAGEGGAPERVAGRTVILSAGAIHSPALLMRAGIGPAASLRGLGIPVIADRPGVGANLQEHPGISVSALLAPQARLRGSTRRHIHLGLRYSSGDRAASDMYLMAAAKSAWHPLGERIGTLIAWINKPYSRGRVVLQGPDPLEEPVAEFNYLADPRDLQRLVAAVRMMAGLLLSPALGGAVRTAGPSSYSGFARALGRQTARNYVLTASAAKALDWVPPLRTPFFRRFVGGGQTLAGLLGDADALEEYVRRGVFGQWHPCGTCRMGDASDRDAVVEPSGARVYGVSGLRVVDASIMPTAPRANLNLPTIMLAEKLADAIAREDGRG